ncbi:MAG TPA: UPF0158 family protein [Vicinamibacteria bacterium]|nr:UPF0158 family protein [Vicinamibacteria bacterium]
MKHRLPIDWDELEMALTWRADEGGYYLDLTSGQLVSFTGLDDELAAGEIDAGLAEGRLLPVEPLPSSVEYGWMSEFVESVTNPSLRRLLDLALDGSGAFRRFKTVLADYPAQRQRWFAFRGERLRQAMQEWLEENGVEATTDDLRNRQSRE